MPASFCLIHSLCYATNFYAFLYNIHMCLCMYVCKSMYEYFAYIFYCEIYVRHCFYGMHPFDCLPAAHPACSFALLSWRGSGKTYSQLCIHMHMYVYLCIFFFYHFHFADFPIRIFYCGLWLEKLMWFKWRWGGFTSNSIRKMSSKCHIIRIYAIIAKKKTIKIRYAVEYPAEGYAIHINGKYTYIWIQR